MNKHKRLLKIIQSNFGLLFLVFLFGACSEKKENPDFVAKIDDEYLTEKDINQYLDIEKYNNFHKSEFVYNWIEKELLYREALQFEIEKDSSVVRIVDDLKKELLGSFVLKKYLEENTSVPTQTEIELYFDKYRENFVIQDDAFIINKMTFDNRDKAVLFRNTLAGSNWQKASAVFSGDESIVDKEQNHLLYQYQLTPIKLARVIKNLKPGEYSIVFEIDPDKYSIIQLESKLKKRSIPELEEIKDLVTKRYLILQRNQLIKKYISDLYKKYNVEIKR